jgi:voltage-gated potassium channel
MNDAQHVAPSAAPEIPRMVRRWIIPANVLAAMAATVWIPLRMVYFRNVSAGGPIDYAIDFSVAVLMLVNQWPRFARRRRKAGALLNAGGGWSLAADFAVAFPLFSVLQPFLGARAEYALLIKLLMFRRIFSIHLLLDEIADLHPVLVRLIPLGFIVPLVINLIACGWSWLGSGSSGRSLDRGLDYIRAVYWTITTLATVGYGDITPDTKAQMIYASLTMLVGIGFFGFVLGNIASLLVRLDAAREAHLETLSRVDSFMRGNAMPAPLRSRVREYYRYVWKSHQGHNVNAILDDLPPKLRADVSLFLNAEMIENVPILKGADRRLLEELVIELKPRVIIPGEVFFCTGDPGDGMYFILRGAVEIVAADGTVLATLGASSFFGEGALLAARPRNAGARAVGYGDVFFLNREAFERVLNRHADFREQVHAIAATRTGNTHPSLPSA